MFNLFAHPGGGGLLDFRDSGGGFDKRRVKIQGV